jgi:folate-binding protein YgfZ
MSEPTLIGAGRSEIVWVTGPDAISFLDGLLSQSIARIPIGGTARSLLLAPNGKLRASLFVLRDDNRVGLVCDAGRSGVVAGDLSRFKIRVDVQIAAATEPVWEVWGSGAAAAVGDVPPAGSWADGPTRFRMPFRHVATERIVLVGDTPPGELAPPAALEAIRIAAGEPVMGVDLDDGTIPQEAGDVGDAVDFTKGCYLGQELVARIASRGHVNRLLRGLVVDGAAPEPGAEIIRDGKVVGAVTSAAESEARQSAVALAMIRVEVEPGARVVVAGARGQIVDLPMSS